MSFSNKCITSTRTARFLLAFGVLCWLASGCSPTETDNGSPPTETATATPIPQATATLSPTATVTPTPTPLLPVKPTPSVTPPPSGCHGLAGNLEISIQVGPADAVGLEPVAVGEIPFSTSGDGEPYTVTGSGTIEYSDILVEEWGSYAVTLNMEAEIVGTCTGSEGEEQLALTVTLSGEQLVVVTTEGFNSKYPWSGTHTFDLELPVTDGAVSQGEGWAFTVHLN